MSSCLIASSGFTGKIIYNLCDGTQTFIPYSGLELFGVGIVLFAIAACIALLGFLGWSITRDD